jgi:hypothetical protein
MKKFLADIPLEGGLLGAGVLALGAIFKLIEKLNEKREERRKAEIESGEKRHAVDRNIEQSYLSNHMLLLKNAVDEKNFWAVEANTWRKQAELHAVKNGACEEKCRQLEYDVQELTEEVKELRLQIAEMQRRFEGKGRG